MPTRGGFLSKEARTPIEYHRSDRTTNAGPRPHHERGTARRRQEPSARPIIDHLWDEKVGEIVGGLEDAFRELPVPRQPAMLNGRRSANASVRHPDATRYAPPNWPSPDSSTHGALCASNARSNAARGDVRRTRE
jgi:hypothetical protein